MPPIAVERWYDEIEASTETLAELVHGADLTRQVPTCPEWTLRQLATHTGRAHRWAAEIVGTRSAEFIPFRQVPEGRIPDDPALHAPWLRAGAALVIESVREAGSDPVWTFDGPQPASFWARRMAHETAVHRADAQITAGRVPEFDADLAADAIDEWLGFMSGIGASDSRVDALPDGAVLHVHVTDDGVDGEWLVRRAGSTVSVESGHGKGDVVVRGPAGRVLLVLLRRVQPDDPQVEVLGDAALLTGWLAGTPF
ncbi:MAG: maleylpyruvate isomerase family mycothiol-dependent enzyme [Streptosporangiaceae bacterium]